MGATPKTRGTRQLVDGGKLDLIKSKEIQRASLDYETAMVEAIEQTKTAYSYSQPITIQITNNIRYAGRNITSSSDELRNSPALISAFKDKFIWQRIQLDVLNDVHKASDTLEQLLAQYLVENYQPLVVSRSIVRRQPHLLEFVERHP